MSKNRHNECDDEKEDNDFDADNNDDESIICFKWSKGAGVPGEHQW